MAITKTKPVPGHKLAGTSYGVATRCECGWISVTCFGKGAHGEALKLWRAHQEIHVRACEAA